MYWYINAYIIYLGFSGIILITPIIRTPNNITVVTYSSYEQPVITFPNISVLIFINIFSTYTYTYLFIYL